MTTRGDRRGAAHTNERRLFLYEGKTLEEWLPAVVERIVERFDPLKVILFGSLARGEVDYDSDIDLLVVFPEMTGKDKRDLPVEIRVALADVPVPMDILVTDTDEVSRRDDLIGGVLRPALREGRVVYERAG